MKYKTLIGAVGSLDEELNELAAKGWVVHSFVSVSNAVVDIEGRQDEVPVLSYLMCIDDTPEPSSRPERRVLGRSG